MTLELADLSPARLVLPPGENPRVGDEIDAFCLRQIAATPDEFQALCAGGSGGDHSVIQVASDFDLVSSIPAIRPPYDVGFAVFETDTLLPEVVERARRTYRYFAAGSTYCADTLRRHGFSNVLTALHGVDTMVFHPPVDAAKTREIWRDRFVVFSGGKFEFRKGQDIVIRAYKVLQDRHKDVALINSWYNGWPESVDTMSVSQLIKFSRWSGEPNTYPEWMNGLLTTNGIDVSRVLTLTLCENRLLPRVYYNTDVGVFPNRIEGGTNMLLMEYMACGKPAIAAYNSGQRDVLRAENSVLIREAREIDVQLPGKPRTRWTTPGLEETIEHLEWCYQNRDRLGAIGAQAHRDMEGFTWKRVAENVLEAVRRACGGHGRPIID